MSEIMVITFVIFLFGLAIVFLLPFLKKRKPNVTEIVDEYVIDTQEKEGFKLILLKLKCASGSVYNFEWQPAHAHYFSDELAIKAVRAAPIKK